MKIETIKVGELETNCYLIIINNKCIIVDPGDEFNLIKNRISELNLIPVAIFVTHYHFDHIGVLNDCVNEYKIDIYDNKIFENDNKEYQIGEFKFNIIYFPGHKSDLVAFYFKESNVMFVGDFIFKHDIGRCDLPTGDFNEMKKSIEKLKKYSIDTILYPGHGEKTKLSDEIKHNEYF